MFKDGKLIIGRTISVVNLNIFFFSISFPWEKNWFHSKRVIFLRDPVDHVYIICTCFGAAECNALVWVSDKAFMLFSSDQKYTCINIEFY